MEYEQVEVSLLNFFVLADVGWRGHSPLCLQGLQAVVVCQYRRCPGQVALGIPGDNTGQVTMGMSGP